jgi:hypothetical protein
VLLTDLVRRAATLTDPDALLWAAIAASVTEGIGAGRVIIIDDHEISRAAADSTAIGAARCLAYSNSAGSPAPSATRPQPRARLPATGRQPRTRPHGPPAVSQPSPSVNANAGVEDGKGPGG